jgi:hypothetical protein
MSYVFWIPVFAGMTLLCSDTTQGRQNELPLFVIPDLIGNPGFLLPLLRPNATGNNL